MFCKNMQSTLPFSFDKRSGIRNSVESGFARALAFDKRFLVSHDRVGADCPGNFDFSKGNTIIVKESDLIYLNCKDQLVHHFIASRACIDLNGRNASGAHKRI